MKRFNGEIPTYPANTREYVQGYYSWQVGRGEEACPYPQGMTHRQRWFAGWIQARTEERLENLFWNVYFGCQEKESSK